MAPFSRRIALVCGIAVAVFSAVTVAQQQVYRYVDKDGRVIYTDRAPPPDGKEVQAKRLSPNYIENNDAADRNRAGRAALSGDALHVSCGAVCQNAEALLNRRGVPFTTVNVEDQKGAELLMKLTGAQQAPVLQVGDKLVAKGFNEARWTAMLDDAGYPKSPPSRRVDGQSGRAAAPAADPPHRPTQRRLFRCLEAATRSNSAARARIDPRSSLSLTLTADCRSRRHIGGSMALRRLLRAIRGIRARAGCAVRSARALLLAAGRSRRARRRTHRGCGRKSRSSPASTGTTTDIGRSSPKPSRDT